MIVFPSAYLAAFPRALASETILLPHRMRLTPARTITFESDQEVTPFPTGVCCWV